MVESGISDVRAVEEAKPWFELVLRLDAGVNVRNANVYNSQVDQTHERQYMPVKLSQKLLGRNSIERL